MIYRLLYLSLVTLVKLIFPDGVETLQTFQSGIYDVMLKNKTVPTNSSNLIKSFQSRKKLLCLVACNQNFLCMLVLYNKTSCCSLYKVGALNELINSAIGEETTVYQNQISNGLINYWPIVNDLKDYIGSSDITTGSLNTNEKIGFSLDRFNTANGSIYMNPGYYILPPGIYFYNSFSFLVWVKVITYDGMSRIIDCGGNGSASDNILIAISDGTSFTRPYSKIYRKDIMTGYIQSETPLTNATWTHLALVYDGQNLMMYLNGKLVANTISTGSPNVIERQKCYLGRTNWSAPDVSAYFDDLMIYNRSLTANEIQILMNYSFK